VREELRNQQYYNFLVPHQLVNKHFPVLIVVVVNKQMLNLSKVAPFLLVALHELMLKSLNLGHHLVRIQDAYIVDPSLGLELTHLSVEEFDIVFKVDGLVVC